MIRECLWLLPLLLVSGQEPTPAPVPPIAILASEQVPLGRWVAIHVDAPEAKGLTVRVRQVLPGEDKYVPDGLLDRGGGDYGFTWDPGTYVIEAQAIAGDAIVSATTTTTIGEKRPDPTPPDPVPVVPGQRWVVLIRETADSTPALAQLVTSLRTSSAQKYADEKGHKLLVLDDDAKTPLGQPLPEMQAWTQYLASKQISLPALVVVDPSRPGAGGVLFAGSAPKTADEVLSLLKAHGG